MTDLGQAGAHTESAVNHAGVVRIKELEHVQILFLTVMVKRVKEITRKHQHAILSLAPVNKVYNILIKRIISLRQKYCLCH